VYTAIMYITIVCTTRVRIIIIRARTGRRTLTTRPGHRARIVRTGIKPAA
jgi:hypothetical protein